MVSAPVVTEVSPWPPVPASIRAFTAVAQTLGFLLTWKDFVAPNLVHVTLVYVLQVLLRD